MDETTPTMQDFSFDVSYATIAFKFKTHSDLEIVCMAFHFSSLNHCHVIKITYVAPYLIEIIAYLVLKKVLIPFLGLEKLFVPCLALTSTFIPHLVMPSFIPHLALSSKLTVLAIEMNGRDL